MEIKYLTQRQFDTILLNITGLSVKNDDGSYIFTPDGLESFKVIIGESYSG